jgi:hypothetical protein
MAETIDDFLKILCEEAGIEKTEIKLDESQPEYTFFKLIRYKPNDVVNLKKLDKLLSLLENHAKLYTDYINKDNSPLDDKNLCDLLLNHFILYYNYINSESHIKVENFKKI